ncbi:MAG: ComEA family DNA-binding protein [Candidatus Daviesbacteria bacterium]|nr:ComEA family DNA-binding protein [Candidatus Daviesbacteria bacterium]
MEEENKFNHFLDQNKIPLGIGLVGLVLLIGGVVSSGIIPKTFIKSTKTPASAQIYQGASVVSAQIKIDVSGEVKNPGVYNLPRDSRIEDALKAAGGVTESADQNYMSKTINLAQKVSDGMKIYVPKISEAGSSGVISPEVVGADPSVAGLINVNTASPADLDKLSGVGEKTAQKIIDNRPYNGIEDLLTKKAVTRSTYDKIKEKVTVW